MWLKLHLNFIQKVTSSQEKWGEKIQLLVRYKIPATSLREIMRKSAKKVPKRSLLDLLVSYFGTRRMVAWYKEVINTSFWEWKMVPGRSCGPIWGDLRPEVWSGDIRFFPFFGERDLSSNIQVDMVASGKEIQEGTFPAIWPVNPLWYS